MYQNTASPCTANKSCVPSPHIFVCTMASALWRTSDSWVKATIFRLPVFPSILFQPLRKLVVDSLQVSLLPTFCLHPPFPLCSLFLRYFRSVEFGSRTRRIFDRRYIEPLVVRRTIACSSPEFRRTVTIRSSFCFLVPRSWFLDAETEETRRLANSLVPFTGTSTKDPLKDRE